MSGRKVLKLDIGQTDPSNRYSYSLSAVRTRGPSASPSPNAQAYSYCDFYSQIRNTVVLVPPLEGPRRGKSCCSEAACTVSAREEGGNARVAEGQSLPCGGGPREKGSAGQGVQRKGEEVDGWARGRKSGAEARGESKGQREETGWKEVDLVHRGRLVRRGGSYTDFLNGQFGHIGTTIRNLFSKFPSTRLNSRPPLQLKGRRVRMWVCDCFICEIGGCKVWYTSPKAPLMPPIIDDQTRHPPNTLGGVAGLSMAGSPSYVIPRYIY